MEKIKDRPENIVLDVCHNIDGFKAVLNEIKTTYPEVKDIKMVFGISKSKKLDDLIDYLEKEPLISDIHLVSRPHMRLYKVEEAHKILR